MTTKPETADPLVLRLMLHSANERAWVWEQIAKSAQAELTKTQEELRLLQRETARVRARLLWVVGG